MDYVTEDFPPVTPVERLNGILPRLQEAYDQIVPPYSTFITPINDPDNINGWEIAVLQEYDPRFESSAHRQVHISKAVNFTGRGPSRVHMEMLGDLNKTLNFMPRAITYGNNKLVESLEGTTSNLVKVVCLVGQTQLVKISVLPGGSSMIVVTPIDPEIGKIDDTRYLMYLVNSQGQVGSVIQSDGAERTGDGLSKTDQVMADNYLLLAEVCAEIASN